MTPQEQRSYEAGYTTGFMDASVKLHEQRSVSDVEPVAKYTGETYRCPMVILYKDIPVGTLLYTTPPYVATPRQSKPLTDEQICPWFQENTALTNEAAMRITRAIEAAHGITDKE